MRGVQAYETHLQPSATYPGHQHKEPAPLLQRTTTRCSKTIRSAGPKGPDPRTVCSCCPPAVQLTNGRRLGGARQARQGHTLSTCLDATYDTRCVRGPRVAAHFTVSAARTEATPCRHAPPMSLRQLVQRLQHVAPRVLGLHCPLRQQTVCTVHCAASQRSKGTPPQLLTAAGWLLPRPLPTGDSELCTQTLSPLSAQASSTLHMHNAKHVPIRAPFHGRQRFRTKQPTVQPLFIMLLSGRPCANVRYDYRRTMWGPPCCSSRRQSTPLTPPLKTPPQPTPNTDQSYYTRLPPLPLPTSPV